MSGFLFSNYHVFLDPDGLFGGSGEANTAANIGVGGVGLFDAKVGVVLNFKNINAGSSKITVTDDAVNNEVDIDVDESSISINSLGGTPLTVPNGGTGNTTLTSGNVLVGAGAAAVTTTKAAPTGDFVGTTDSQSLTNKTISGSTNTVHASHLQTTGAAVDVVSAAPPSVGQILKATSATTATWQNEAAASTTFTDDTFAIQDAVDNTIEILFDAAGSTGTSTTLASSQTVNRVITFPDATTTVVGTDVTQTLTNKTLTSPVLTTPEINDTSLDHQYVFAVNELTADRTVTLPLLTGDDTFVFEAHPQILSNKTLTLPQINDTSEDHQYVFAVNELTADRTVTLPLLTGNDTFVFEAHSQTLTNKDLVDSSTAVVDAGDNTIQILFDAAGTTSTSTTLTSSQTANRVLTLPDVTDTIVARTTTDTLTNKTITATTNTVRATQLGTTGADVVVSTSAPPSTGDILVATSATAAAWQAPDGSGARVAYPLVTTSVVSASSTSYTTVAYLTWDDSRYSGYTSGTLVFEVDITNRNLDIRLRDTTNAVTLGETLGISVDGFNTLSVSNPSSDARMELQVRKSAGGGVNPLVYGISLEYVQ